MRAWLGGKYFIRPNTLHVGMSSMFSWSRERLPFFSTMCIAYLMLDKSTCHMFQVLLILFSCSVELGFRIQFLYEWAIRSMNLYYLYRLCICVVEKISDHGLNQGPFMPWKPSLSKYGLSIYETLNILVNVKAGNKSKHSYLLVIVRQFREIFPLYFSLEVWEGLLLLHCSRTFGSYRMQP